MARVHDGTSIHFVERSFLDRAGLPTGRVLLSAVGAGLPSPILTVFDRRVAGSKEAAIRKLCGRLADSIDGPLEDSLSRESAPERGSVLR